MNTKVVFRIAIALALYGVFVILVVLFYDDSPENMKWEDRQAYNKQYIGKLNLDVATSEKVLTELGSPDITEATKSEYHKYQVMYYRTQHVKSDGLTSIEECTALLFKDGVLIAIGKTAENQFNQVSTNS